MADADPAEIAALKAAVAGKPGAEWATDAVCTRYLRARDSWTKSETMLAA